MSILFYNFTSIVCVKDIVKKLYFYTYTDFESHAAALSKPSLMISAKGRIEFDLATSRVKCWFLSPHIAWLR